MPHSEEKQPWQLKNKAQDGGREGAQNVEAVHFF